MAISLSRNSVLIHDQMNLGNFIFPDIWIIAVFIQINSIRLKISGFVLESG
jgi:hypothetical protein